MSDGGPRPQLPTTHMVACAIHAAALLDRPASPVTQARAAYWHQATGGTFGPGDLRLGERLLVELGFVAERDGRLYPTWELDSLLDATFDDIAAAMASRAIAQRPPPAGELAELVPDAARREQLLVALGRRFDDEQRRLYGAIGEEIVVAAARAELEDLGRGDLARRVRHVSLETDQAGYDVSAPRVAGPARLFEVKATSAPAADPVVVHLSRNEAETGLRYADWTLVVCAVDDTDRRTGSIVGWTAAGLLGPSLPADRVGGRWESAAVEVPLASLSPGLPAA